MQAYTVSKTASLFAIPYPAAIRIWHWATFLLMAASIVTVLFASTLFEVKEEGIAPGNGTAQTTLHQNGGEGSQRRFDPSRLAPETRAALTYSHKIWNAHKIIGFGLCFLFLSRVAIEASRNKKDRLGTRIRKALSLPAYNRKEQQEQKHFILVKRGYLVFYVLFAVMALTGLIMAFEHTPLLEAIQRPSRQVHETVQYLVYTYILLHLIGVIRADLTKQKGIVSAMINGGPVVSTKESSNL